jgi:hypothetical protein
MQLSECPYCNQPGLVTRVRIHQGGMDVTGKCATCGYSYDSEYADSDVADDLPFEDTRPLDAAVAD